MMQGWINNYLCARKHIINNESRLIIDEEYRVTHLIIDRLVSRYKEIKKDFDNAYATKGYWENYAPIQRGHKPRNESYPWGEVGEKVIEGHLYSSLNDIFGTPNFPGIPYGHDIRFSTENSFVHIDVKSTGPNDNTNEIVSSPNQVTGNGMICHSGMIYNDEVDMIGPQKTRKFRPELAPFYLIDGKIIPVLTFYIKVVYDVIFPGNQPLAYIELICVPNGIPLFVSPNFNQSFPGILTPGKDQQNVLRRRTRIKLNPLSMINDWRCQKIFVNANNDVEVSKRCKV